MPNNQFFDDWVTGDVITAEKLNRMKNNVQAYLGQVLVDVAHSHDNNTRYYYLGRIHNNDGFLKVRGILGGHTPEQGRANVDLQFSFRGGLRVDGYVMGTVGQADIVAMDGIDGWAYIFLVTQLYALVKLELSKQGMGEIGYNGYYSLDAPGGSTIYRLRDDFAQNSHPHTLKVSNGILQARYDHRDRFTIDAFLGGTALISIDSYSQLIIRRMVARVPAGKALYLKRVRVQQPPGIFARIETSYLSDTQQRFRWDFTPSLHYEELDLDVKMYEISNYNYVSAIDLFMYNGNSDSALVGPADGYIVEFEIR